MHPVLAVTALPADAALGALVALVEVGIDEVQVAHHDAGAVEGLVGRLQSAQMKSIVANDATPADLKKYGLEWDERYIWD